MFVTRLISGIILVVIALATIIAGGPVLAGILLLISCIALLELTRATAKKTADEKESKKTTALEVTGILGTILYYGLLYGVHLSGTEASFYQLFAVMIVFLAEMFVYVFAFPRFQSEQVMAAFFSFVYAPVMLSFIFLTRHIQLGAYLVWLIFISSWGCDTCAYCVGVLFGKHKMSPILSPKKSIEGAVGGVCGAALLGALYAYLVVDRELTGQNLVLIFALISAVAALISMVGDLAASAIKRNHEIKDYGKLIPGHGGIMDRFDSVIFTAPVIYFMAMLIIKA